MTTYKQIIGKSVKNLSSDPSNDASTGQVWYNNSSNVFKTTLTTSAWSSGGSLITAQNGVAAFGIQTAAVATGGSPYTNSVQKYNGTGFASATNYPINVAFAGAAGTETAGLVFGGISSPPGNTNSINTTNEYNGSSWTGGGNMNSQRSQFSGLGTQTAAVAALGFLNTTTTTSNSEEYNGTAWSEGNNANNARRNTGAAGLETAGLVFGGGPPAAPNNHSEEYNGTSWSEGNNLNTARLMGSQTGAGIQTSALAFGGSADPPVTNATEKYDGTSWTTVPATLATARYAPGCGTSTAVVAAGGRTNTANVSVTEEYNDSATVVTGAVFSSGGAMVDGRGFIQSAGQSTQSASLVFGGWENPPGARSLVEEYNGSSWSEVNNMPETKYYGGGAGTQTAAYGTGGYGGSPETVNAKTFEYDGTNWSSGGDLNNNRAFFGSTGTLTAGLAFGGGAGTGSGVQTEEYNGTAWRSVNNLPATNTGMAAVGIQTAALSAGGDPASTRGASAEYDGTNWTAGNSMNRDRGQQAGGFGTQTSGIVVCGNIPPGNNLTTTSEEYDGTTFATSVDAATARNYLGSSGATQTNGLIMGGALGPLAGTPSTEEFTTASEAINVKTITTS